MPGSDGLRILGDFWKKADSWVLKLDETSWFLDLGEASPVMDYGMPARCWVRRNSQHSRNCLSLLVSKSLKVKKVIKVSYLNKENRQCFAYFGIPMHMNVLHIGIFHIMYHGYITVVNVFELQPRYYFHFRTNTLEKSTNRLIPTQLWVQ